MAANSQPIVRVQNLSKRFGELQAVHQVSFDVGGGEIFGLLGPNGAGKSTTLGMISSLLKPDDGIIQIGDHRLSENPTAAKGMLGIVPQETALYEELSAIQNLRFWAALYGLEKNERDQAIEAILDRVGLLNRSKEPVNQFSGGMKRRLNLAMGLVHRPQVVLMDEPTVGIDPQARLNILEVVRETAREGAAVIYTTHYLEEAESLCDRIGIMDHGKLLATGTLASLQQMVGDGDVVTAYGLFETHHDLRENVSKLGLEIISLDANRLVVASDQHGGGAEALEKLRSLDLSLERVSIQPPSLNGLFIKLTGRELRD